MRPSNTCLFHVQRITSRFAYGREERIWGFPQSSGGPQPETLRSVDIDSLMHTETQWVEDEAILQSIVDRGLLKQPQSVYAF